MLGGLLVTCLVHAHAANEQTQTMAHTMGITPTAAVHAVADHIIKDTKDEKKFQIYGYGQSIILDAMMLAAEKVDGMQHVMPRYNNTIRCRLAFFKTSLHCQILLVFLLVS